MGGRWLVVMAVLSAGTGDEPSPTAKDREAYEAAEKGTGRDAGAHVRLALWCEAHGMTAERTKHLAAAVVADPSNALARGLMGLVVQGGKWERPDDVSREARDDPKQKALMQEYLERRAKAPDKADHQWKLAAWCEQNGLKEQAVAHYHAVVRLDPRREAAWKHLGFKKVGGRWVKPEWQAAARQEAGEQDRANKHWKPLLVRWRSELSSRDRARRAEAEAGLIGVTDPRAVPAVWALFVTGGAGGHEVAVRLLGQIDSPGSSRALTLLALRSPDAEVRAKAIQLLRWRDPRDFAPMLVGLLRDKIKYEVRRVNGPGSRGELLIKGKNVNIDRVYAPPPAPFVPLLPGDSVTYDAAGLPVISRLAGTLGSSAVVPGNNLAAVPGLFGLPAPGQTLHTFDQMGLPANVAAKLDAIQTQAMQVPISINVKPGDLKRGTKDTWLTATEFGFETEQIYIGQMMLETQKAALVAEQQLEGDVRAIQVQNASVQAWNQCVLQVLTSATGTDLGEERTPWDKWIVDLFGYAYSSSSSSDEPPTVVQQVPLAYQPQPVPVTFSGSVTGIQVQAHHSCFGAGTPIRTLDGLQPIESLRAGDLVLTEDTTSGELKYQAIVAVYHNPPNATHRVALADGSEIVATGIHRLWKAGKGWTMVRELKPGDVLRTLGGVAAVKSIEADRNQPVYNLRVADGESYFVGSSGVLAHDNSTINPVPEPFDAVGPLTTTSSPAAKTRSMLGR